MRPLLEPWATRENVFTAFRNDELAVAIDVACGEDKDQVVKKVMDRFRGVAETVKVLKSKRVAPDDV